MKTCTKCRVDKPLAKFWPDKRRKSGRMARCKRCKVDDARDYRRARPELGKAIYLRNKDAVRERLLRRKYGVGLADYAAMLVAQDGCCAICDKEEPPDKMLDVDHDHATGVVRGLLCTNCNRMVGHAHDSADLLEAGATYLRRIVPQVAAEFIKAVM